MGDLQQWLRANDASEIECLIKFDGKWRPFKSDPDRRWISSIILEGTRRIEIVTLYDWRSGESLTYHSGGGFKNEEQRQSYNEAVRRRAEESKKEREAEQEAAAKEAERLWEQGLEIQERRSDYLHRKGINGPIKGIRVSGDALLIPMRDIFGKLWGVQRIFPDGAKRFLSGQRKRETYFRFEGNDKRVLCFCEGFATGASVSQATGYTVIVAFDSGNLLPVVRAFSNLDGGIAGVKYIICGDDDRWSEKNVGREKATQAAESVGGIAIFPKFKGGY